MKIDTHYQTIITELVDKYGLTRGEVIKVVEKTFVDILSRWLGKKVIVLFDNNLQAMAYVGHGSQLVQEPVEVSRMRGWNTIKRKINASLQLEACLQEINRLNRFKRKKRIFSGEILKRKTDQSFLVEMEIEPGIPLITEALANHIGIHERLTFRPGNIKKWHLRRIDPIDRKGTPQIRILIDRVSKNLVTGLFREHNCSTAVCTRRYVGHKSFVTTKEYIQPKIIKEISSEIGEHIQIQIKRDDKS